MPLQSLIANFIRWKLKSAPKQVSKRHIHVYPFRMNRLFKPFVVELEYFAVVNDATHFPINQRFETYIVLPHHDGVWLN